MEGNLVIPIEWYRKYGVEEATLLTFIKNKIQEELKNDAIRTKNGLRTLVMSDGFMHITKEEIKTFFGIKEGKCGFLLKRLTNHGVLEIRRNSLPQRNFYKVTI